MLINYLKTAYRSLSRGKVYTFLNVLGLAVGLACFAIIMAWVLHQLSFDGFHEKQSRIYRLAGTVTTDAEVFEQAVTSPPMAEALIRDFPEVESAVTLDKNDCIVRRGEKQFIEDGVLFTDSSFFDIFSYQLTLGDERSALRDPYSIVLTASMAEKYFDEENPLGKSITLFLYDPDGRGADYTVTGVIPDSPQNAHFTFNFLGSFSTFPAAFPEARTSEDYWFWNGFYTYLLLKPNTDPQQLEAKLPDFAERYMGDKMREMNMFYTFRLQPLGDIHLHSKLRYEIQPTGSMNTVIIFATIGIFILLIACINYMNLATARSLARAKEVGVKKVVGAAKRQLILQFLGESCLVAFFALILALLFIELAEPLTLRIMKTPPETLLIPRTFGLLAAAALAVGILSGIYPALYISSFKPVEVLRGAFRSGASGIAIRKGLVIFQFAVSIILLIGISVINQQMSFIQKKDLGFNKEELLVLNVNGFAEVQQGIDAFSNDLKQSPEVKGVAVSRGLIIGGLSNSLIETVDNSGNPVSSSIYRLQVSPEYLAVYGMKMIAGRNFDAAIASDSTDAFILNESAVKVFGWGEAENAIGKPIKRSERESAVIGVVKDFHFASLQKPIEPVAISITPKTRFSRIAVRIKTEKINETLRFVEKTWKAHFPAALYEFSFMDERLTSQYHSEMVFRQVFTAFVALSLFIACLGLFGLASYATRQRVKEIGIRKVLGASVANVVTLLSKDFAKLVALANIVAWPLAWFAMSRWLQDFAYRIEIGWWVFLLSGGLALLIAILTVSYQAVKAALSNPVEALRYE